ncbi:NUDIX hydrolase [Falsibacillus albus]|uniref:NUDIX hydrolase n=1 Tax=Falsibacillus albus TaxID=2478915 RepID=A0A3L7JTU3_9BACI|nr:NUDIX hydrolase [Falsibacillus albus]RLQ94248.1 NUDIX hydrolase [Falsibacillus albus]
MKLRQMAVALLFNSKEEMLFIQKKKKDSLFKDLFLPIGGHMEYGEMNDPHKACLREIEEETGLKEDVLNELRLKYIVLRMKALQEVRMQYVFVGNVLPGVDLQESEEGSLFWCTPKSLPDHVITATTKEIIYHYQHLGAHDESTYCGSMKSNNGEPEISWSLLEDWEAIEV